jgi:hypothetical protein
MLLSEMASYLAESLTRMLGAVVAVLFGCGYWGQLTGQPALSTKPVRWLGVVMGGAITLGGSALMRWLVSA